MTAGEKLRTEDMALLAADAARFRWLLARSQEMDARWNNHYPGACATFRIFLPSPQPSRMEEGVIFVEAFIRGDCLRGAIDAAMREEQRGAQEGLSGCIGRARIDPPVSEGREQVGK